MQRLDEAKRREIVKTAAKLFAKLPFHEVTLDAIAAKAGIGKGTLYVYFASKEDLYCSLLRDGFSELVDDLKRELDDGALAPWQRMSLIVERVVGYAFRVPHMWELMRAGIQPVDIKREEHRRELARLIETAIRDGVRSGDFTDEHPELTAHYALAFVRAAMLNKRPNVGERAVAAHILSVLGSGLQHESPAKKKHRSRT